MSLFSGEETLEAEDLRIRGRGMDFVWTRTYRSKTGRYTVVGHNWDHSYNVGLYRTGADLVLYDGTGRRDIYRLQPDGSYQRPEFFRRIDVESDGSLTVRFANQGRWNFHPFIGSGRDGLLRRTTDRNGNRLLFEHSSVGRLTNVVDTLDRSIRMGYDTNGFLVSVTDFAGRRIRYEYYGADEAGGEFGDLKSVTQPGVAIALPGNIYPDGKTTRYTYTKGFADDRLNHNLLTITDPKGQTYLRNTYAGTTDPDELLFDRVIRQAWGASDDVTDMTYEVFVPSPEFGDAVLRAIVNDRVGNVSEHYFDKGNRLVLRRDFTGRADPDRPTTASANRPKDKLRIDDPEFFETRFEYNADSLLQRRIQPNGNRIEFVYESDIDPLAEPEARGNLRARRFVPGTHSPAGDQAEIVETFEYATGLGGCCGGFNFLTRHVDGRGHEKRHEYDDRGNRIRTLDRVAGVEQQFEYNLFGQRTVRIRPDNGSGHRRRDEWTYHDAGPQRGFVSARIVDVANLKVTTRYEYDAVGNVVRRTNPRGFATESTYNELDQLVRRRMPESREGSGLFYVREYAYDANNNLSRVDLTNADDVGIVAANPVLTQEYAYEVLNRLIRVATEVEPGRAVTIEYEYDAERNRTLVRSGEAVAGRQTNAVVLTQYDERNLPHRIIRAPGAPEQSTDELLYDGNGNMIRLSVGLEDQPRITGFVYDGYDRLVGVRDPMGNLRTYEYDANGNRVRQTAFGELVDQPGNALNVRLEDRVGTFDAMNRPTQVATAFFDAGSQQPIGDGWSIATTAYSPNSQVLSVVNDNGNETRYEFDTVNRRSRVLDAAGNTVEFEYDAASNLVRIHERDHSDLGGPESDVLLVHEYDPLNRIIATIDAVGNAHHHAYDSRDNIVREVDLRGNVTQTRFDGMNRPVETVRRMTATGEGGGLPAGIVRYTFAWDDNSRPTSRVDDNGNVTASLYDALSREIRTTFGDGSAREFIYDAHGNRVATIEPNRTRLDAVYDLLNRRVRWRYAPGPGVVTDTTFEEFDYDGLSRLVRADNDVSRLSRGHDSLSRVTWEAQGDAEVRTLYDGVGNPLLCVYPSGRVVTNSFDRLERLSRVSDADGELGRYWYRGPVIARKDLGNGTRQTFLHDGLRRVTEVIHDIAPFDAASRFEHLVMGWGPTSHRTARDRVMPGGEQRRFRYDSLDRMIESARTPAAGPGDNIRYSLDGVGNRTQVVGGAVPGVYTLSASVPPADAQVNQYTTTPFGPLTHDDNGNLVGAGNGAESLGYDVHDRLVRYQRPGISMTYVYDALGRRIGKRAAAPSAFETRFLHHGNRVIEERDSVNRTTASYAYGANLDERLAMDRDGRRVFYHADDLLNVTQVTDASGKVLEEYRYADYGSPAVLAPDGTVRAASAIGNPHLFTGRYLDEESGLYFFRARYLDPAAGRFISRDPLGVWGDSYHLGNAFTYAGSSPWTLMDPTGTSIASTAIIGTALGAAAYYYYETTYKPPGSSGDQASFQYKGNQVDIRTQVHSQTMGSAELAELTRIIGEYEKWVRDPKNKGRFCQDAATLISTQIPGKTPLEHFNIVHEVKPAPEGAVFGGHDYAVVRRGDKPLFVLDPIGVKNSGQGNVAPDNTHVWTYPEHQSTIQSRFGDTPSFIQNH